MSAKELSVTQAWSEARRKVNDDVFLRRSSSRGLLYLAYVTYEPKRFIREVCRTCRICSYYFKGLAYVEPL